MNSFLGYFDNFPSNFPSVFIYLFHNFQCKKMVHKFWSISFGHLVLHTKL